MKSTPADTPNLEAKPGPRKWAVWKKRLLAMLLGTGIALVIGEVGVLLSGVNNDYRNPATSQFIPREGGPYDLAANGYVPYSTMRMNYPTNPRGYFDGNSGIDHKFNSEGWREDEHPEAKPPGEIRILALGDSYLFGQGVKRKDLFIERLGRQLAEHFKDCPVKTINTGQPAYNTWRELRLLKERGLAYDPDLVVLAFVPNDVEPNIFAEGAKVEFFTEFINSYNTNDWLSNYSELWMYLKRTITYQIRGRRYLASSIASYQNHSEKWQACRDSLLKIRTVCREHHVPLLVVAFPFFINLDGNYPFQPIHDQVAATCQKEGIPFLDLREEFRGFHGPELWVHPTDQHPNETAHKLAATAIVKEILSENLLDNPNE